MLPCRVPGGSRTTIWPRTSSADFPRSVTPESCSAVRRCDIESAGMAITSPSSREGCNRLAEGRAVDAGLRVHSKRPSTARTADRRQQDWQDDGSSTACYGSLDRSAFRVERPDTEVLSSFNPVNPVFSCLLLPLLLSLLSSPTSSFRRRLGRTTRAHCGRCVGVRSRRHHTPADRPSYSLAHATHRSGHAAPRPRGRRPPGTGHPGHPSPP